MFKRLREGLAAASKRQLILTVLLALANIVLAAYLALVGYRFVCQQTKVEQVVHLGEDTVRVIGGISPTLAKTVTTHIRELVRSGTTNIDIIIDSTGGTINAAEEIIAEMHNAQALGITLKCYVQRKAMSAGTMILTECDERYAEASSVIMWHSAAFIAFARINKVFAEHTAEFLAEVNSKVWKNTKHYFFPWYFDENFEAERFIPAAEVEANGFGYLRIVRQVILHKSFEEQFLDIIKEFTYGKK